MEVAHAYPYDPNELGYIADRYGNRGYFFIGIGFSIIEYK